MCYQAIRCERCGSDQFTAHLIGSNGDTSANVICSCCNAVLFAGQPRDMNARKPGQWQRRFVNGMAHVAEDMVKGLVNFAFPTKPSYWEKWVKCQYTGKWEKVQLPKRY